MDQILIVTVLQGSSAPGVACPQVSQGTIPSEISAPAGEALLSAHLPFSSRALLLLLQQWPHFVPVLVHISFTPSSPRLSYPITYSSIYWSFVDFVRNQWMVLVFWCPLYPSVQSRTFCLLSIFSPSHQLISKWFNDPFKIYLRDPPGNL